MNDKFQILREFAKSNDKPDKTIYEFILELIEENKILKDRDVNNCNKITELQDQLEEERNKIEKAKECIKGLLDNTDDIICYGIDRHCKDNLLIILGDDE